MRQVWITKAGGPEVLQVREAPDPHAAGTQVRIRVKAAGVNFADLMARLGLYPDAPPLPAVVGYEVAGVVDEVGTTAARFAPGDRVFALCHFGGYSDTVVVDESQAFAIPEGMTDEAAAALPVNYLTAHHMMFFIGPLREGSRVFVHSIAGGVGLAAVELAHTRHCTLYGTASVAKHEFLRAHGVVHPIDSAGDWAAQARRILDGEKADGFDLVLDAVGGRSWKESYRLLAPCGRLVAFGFSAVTAGLRRNLGHAVLQLLRIPRFNPMALMNDNRTVSGTNTAHLFDRLDLLVPQFEALLDLARQGKIRPHVDRAFPFAQAGEAHRYLHERRAIGKVVLVP